jgi:dihydrofolate reductase
MPRKVILGFGVSIDGYIARRNGAIDFLVIDKEGEALMADFFAKIDTTIMGRKTASGWLRMRDSGEIPDTPGMANYVISRRWKPGKREGFEVVSGSLTTFVRKLKRRPGKDIYLGGGGRIGPQFPPRGFGGRTLHRHWSRAVRRWHPRLPGQVPAARLQADRMQVLLEWIGRATL